MASESEAVGVHLFFTSVPLAVFFCITFVFDVYFCCVYVSVSYGAVSTPCNEQFNIIINVPLTHHS